MLAIKSATGYQSRAVLAKQSSSVSTGSRASTVKVSGVTKSPRSALVYENVRAFHVSVITEAVPKKKQSYSRVRVRTHSQNWQIHTSDWSHAHPCSRCGKTILRHNVCNHCGWYKGVPIFLRAVQRQETKLAKAALKQQAAQTADASPSL